MAHSILDPYNIIPRNIIYDRAALRELRGHSQTNNSQTDSADVTLGENGSVYKGVLPIRQGTLNPKARELFDYDAEHRNTAETPGGVHKALRDSIQRTDDNTPAPAMKPDHPTPPGR